MLINFKKNDVLKKKIAVSMIWIISLLFIIEILFKLYNTYNNHIAINIPSFILALAISILFILLLFKINFARIVILIASFSMLFSVIYVAISLLNVDMLYGYEIKVLLSRFLPNLLIIYALTNKESLLLFNVKSLKKELIIILPLSVIFLLIFKYILQ